MTGLILVGGQSERMGRAKAMLTFRGETFFARTVSLLQGFCRQIIVVSRLEQPRPDTPGIKIINDEVPGLGPLGGLVTGLAASGDDWHLVLACDLPLLKPEILQLLIDNTPGVAAVVPRALGRLQPLAAAYSQACLTPAREALTVGKRSVTALLDRVPVKLLEEAVLRRADEELLSFVNINTEQDYQDLLRREGAE
jgi:molybdenum cofactor guanylyltransferase